MAFSERQGIRGARDVVQVDEMDAALRNSIWNVIQVFLFDPLDVVGRYLIDADRLNIQRIWSDFFKLPVDDCGDSWRQDKVRIRGWFFAAKWYEVYDFMEFIGSQVDVSKRESYFRSANAYLARELSGYRFVGHQLVPITSKSESAAVETALSATNVLSGVNLHLKSALEKLGDRQNPDPRNSIKESISAVESICRLLTDDPNVTLGAALKRLKSKGVEIHPALERAWNALYGFTSDKDGIRHAMLEEPNLTTADARYMLVSCSAFISYLIELASRSGIDLKALAAVAR